MANAIRLPRGDQLAPNPPVRRFPPSRLISATADAMVPWYSGDTHVHRTLDDLPNLLLAEDLNVGLPLTYWVTTAYTPPGSGDKNMAGRVEARNPSTSTRRT